MQKLIRLEITDVSLQFGVKIDVVNQKDERSYWWTERDLNPRLPRCERGDHARLIYRPISEKNTVVRAFRAFGGFGFRLFCRF
jgi:hypothetical protein